MSARKVSTRLVPREEYGTRWKSALERRAAMERELAAGLVDPALVLAVQATIAACSAFTSYHRGERSSADRHLDALSVLARVPEIDGTADARKHLTRLLEVKTELEYSGRSIRPQEAKTLLEHARRFIDFVGKHLPTSNSAI